MSNNSNRDRYISFQNIDCYQNSVFVLDAINELFEKNPNSKNDFWVRFMETIPENYKEKFEKDGHRDILYQVCSNVFYISDLFEDFDFEKGIEFLDQAELECC